MGYCTKLVQDLFAIELMKIYLGLDSSQVALHTLEPALEYHDASQVIAKFFGGLDETCLVPDPLGGLLAFDVVGLYLCDCHDGIPLLLQQGTEIRPST